MVSMRLPSFLLLLALCVEAQAVETCVLGDHDCSARARTLLQARQGTDVGDQRAEEPRAARELRCEELPESLSYGVYIDGKDTGRGPDAYSALYRTQMQQALIGVEKLQRSYQDGGASLFDVFLKIGALLFKGKDAHAFGEVWGILDPDAMQANYLLRRPKDLSKIRSCTPPPDGGRDPLDGIFVRDAKMKFTRGDMTVEEATKDVFRRYTKSQSTASDEEAQLKNVVWLMRNLAFLHPFYDRNGRSRVLLLQFELRRLGIACGTMMYNNNKNIYFDSADVFLAKLKEGIRMYDEAQVAHKVPWVSEATRAAHAEKFPVADGLKDCWRRNGVADTSVSLKVDHVADVARDGYGRGQAKDAGAIPDRKLSWEAIKAYA